MRAFLWACLSLIVAASVPSCAELRLADAADGGPTAPPPEDGSTSPTNDGAPDADAGPDAPAGPLRYTDTQQALQAKRFPGPTTPQGSKGSCTPKYFVWRESDGTLHSWAGSNQARIDYGFKAVGSRSYFVPADGFIAVDEPTFAQLDVYRTNLPNSLAASIPYAFNFVSANDGVIRLDQVVDGADVGGTKVRRWNASTMMTEDLTTVLPTREPPSSFVNDVLVIPGGTTIPFALWLVDVVKKTTGSVTFDGGISLTQTEEGAGFLVVSYVRSGTSGATMRVYKNNLNDPSSRVEVSDDLANRGNYFSDGPTGEHRFLARIATWKTKILYASAYGIWAYDVVSGSLAPVQLTPGRTSGDFPDVLCVLRDADLLVYRSFGDTLGQVWAVPLKSLGL